MSTTLTIQILVYMGLLSFLAFAWGYSKGHREGTLLGRRQAYRLMESTNRANVQS